MCRETSCRALTPTRSQTCETPHHRNGPRPSRAFLCSLSLANLRACVSEGVRVCHAGLRTCVAVRVRVCHAWLLACISVRVRVCHAWLWACVSVRRRVRVCAWLWAAACVSVRVRVTEPWPHHRPFPSLTADLIRASPPTISESLSRPRVRVWGLRPAGRRRPPPARESESFDGASESA
jgi:hypothetical protein